MSSRTERASLLALLPRFRGHSCVGDEFARGTAEELDADVAEEAVAPRKYEMGGDKTDCQADSLRPERIAGEESAREGENKGRASLPKFGDPVWRRCDDDETCSR